MPDKQSEKIMLEKINHFRYGNICYTVIRPRLLHQIQSTDSECQVPNNATVHNKPIREIKSLTLLIHKHYPTTLIVVS